MIRRNRKSESLENLTNEEIADILTDETKALVDRDADRLYTDEFFRTKYHKYPVMSFSRYTIVPFDIYKDICHDISYHLVYALGDIVGSFIDPDEYYEWTLKDDTYILGAQEIIQKCDKEAYIDLIEEVIDTFNYDGQDYVIFEVY